MDLKKGFITVATGKWYCYLAQNLAMSYRLFGNCDLPFYAITDKKGEKKLKKYFDGVIVVDQPHYNFLDKIDVYKNSPFEETIFMDADMNIVKDISFLFDKFEENGSVSCYGDLKEITDEQKPNHFGKAAVEYFHLKQYIRFGGGIYYYKKSEKADALIRSIYEDLIPNYDKYDLLHISAYFGNDIRSMADEPLMGLAMVVHGMKPLNSVEHLMRYYRGNMMETLQWDMEKQDCSFFWWEETVHPYIVHYATYNTWTWKYNLLNTKLKNRYRKTPALFGRFRILGAWLKWAFSKRQLKEFFQWFFAHFTPSYWKAKFKGGNKRGNTAN